MCVCVFIFASNASNLSSSGGWIFTDEDQKTVDSSRILYFATHAGRSSSRQLHTHSHTNTHARARASTQVRTNSRLNVIDLYFSVFAKRGMFLFDYSLFMRKLHH